VECDAPHLKSQAGCRATQWQLYRNGPIRSSRRRRTLFVGDGMLHAFHLENAAPVYATAGSHPEMAGEHDAAARVRRFGRNCRYAASVTQDAASPIPTSSFTRPPARAREGICRPRSSPARSTGSAIATTVRASRARSRRIPRSIHYRRDGVLGYNAAGPLTRLSFGSAALPVVTRFDASRRPMQHGARLIVTEHHLLFRFSITGSMERAMRGQPPYAWERQGAYVGVMKRNGSAKDIVWFRAETATSSTS